MTESSDSDCRFRFLSECARWHCCKIVCTNIRRFRLKFRTKDMKENESIFIAFLGLLCFLKQGFSADTVTYRAGVVEYYPVQNFSLTPDERTNANVDKYIELIDELADKTFDILVYPEATITTGHVETRENLLELATVVPGSQDHVTPCNDTTFPLYFRKLSCFAWTLSTYLVVNLIEKEHCTSNCASDSWNMYNTDVVFDRNGTVIQRYRKYNLFGEYGMNVTDTAEVATFDTDFDVTFGLFTCFDILFDEPALVLVRQGVKHIVFPTMWFSELPFLTALQAQNMFAVENDVVLLASGANSAARGSGGSGIYQGRFGPIQHDIISDNGSKVYISDVLKVWDSNTVLENQIETDGALMDQLTLAMDNFYLKKDNLSQYKAYPIVSEDFDGILQDETISCRVSWKITYKNVSAEHYEYAFFYRSGVRSFSGVRDAGIDICGVVFCQNFSRTKNGHETCALRYSSHENIQWPFVFEKLSVSSNFTVSDNTVQYPNTLLSSIRPLDRSDFDWTTRYYDNGKIAEKTLTLLKPQDRLLSFAIYGRDFSKDSSAN